MDWNAPVEMVEGVLTNPGDNRYTLVNVPSYLIGGQYVGSRAWPQGSFTWSISYNPPVSLFIWVMDIYLAGADNVLQGDGWSVEDAPGFRRSDGYSLSVWSKSFYDGTSVSVNGLNGLIVAGVVSVCPEALNLFSKAIWRTRALDGNYLVSAPKHHSFAEQDAYISVRWRLAGPREPKPDSERAHDACKRLQNARQGPRDGQEGHTGEHA